MAAALKAVSRLCQRMTLKNASRTFYIYSPDALTPQRDKEPDWKTAEDAVQAIESGNVRVAGYGFGSPGISTTDVV